MDISKARKAIGNMDNNFNKILELLDKQDNVYIELALKIDAIKYDFDIIKEELGSE